MPFARMESGIDVSGNAWEWWENAAGVYERGSQPQPGSVLVFQSNRHMRLGHVAVVARVLGPREIEVDQANWPHGGIERDVSVIDVSPGNDWTAVRVELGRGGNYGSIYPTYGFIYDRVDRGRGEIVTASLRPTPIPVLNPAPNDLRQVGYDEELAEAPAVPLRTHHRARKGVHHANARHTHRVRTSVQG
ncbi:MAG TPA: CHAP domain-containing protein [Acetobacteraceae bacterium]|nr:CHAP domain-containing protein [Acetobacteraceae bacterium]